MNPQPENEGGKEEERGEEKPQPPAVEEAPKVRGCALIGREGGGKATTAPYCGRDIKCVGCAVIEGRVRGERPLLWRR